MASEEHFAILEEGVDVWNQWRKENPDIRPDLREIDLYGDLLRGVDFSKADLFGSDLSADLRRANFNKAFLSNTAFVEADLTEANLHAANLTQANLRRANLRGSDISQATLSETDFSGADLSKTNLRNALFTRAILHGINLNEADLGEAIMNMTLLGNVDLSTVKGLDTIRHYGPSTIGIDTIYRSLGKVPEAFLRGTGVPDDFIAYTSSFISGQPIQFYSCFISYSSQDQEFAEHLHADLQSKKVRCWFAPEDMKIGAEIRQTIDHAIRLHDKVLLVLSEHSVNSGWVQHEVEAAFEEERKRRQQQQRQQTVLFPIRLDGAVMDTDLAWAATIRRQRHVGDFTKWKDHDAYRKALDRLLRDLQAEE